MNDSGSTQLFAHSMESRGKTRDVFNQRQFVWKRPTSVRSWFIGAIGPFWFGMLFMGAIMNLPAQTSMGEYHVKALFLLNFINYVDWPDSSFADAKSPIVIGVLGQDSFDDNLTDAVAGKSVNGREIIIHHFADAEDLTNCSVLFISGSEDSRLSEILKITRKLPILTVGENPSFLQKGGIINFILKEGKIHLQVNLGVARQVGLQISSKLLGVADVVKE
jgi:hypothetical protein